MRRGGGRGGVGMERAPARAPEARPEPSRLSLLKKPLTSQADPIAALRQSITSQPKR